MLSESSNTIFGELNASPSNTEGKNSPHQMMVWAVYQTYC